MGTTKALFSFCYHHVAPQTYLWTPWGVLIHRLGIIVSKDLELKCNMIINKHRTCQHRSVCERVGIYVFSKGIKT